MLAAPAALVDIAFLLVIVAVPAVAVVRLHPGELFTPAPQRAVIAPVTTPAGTAVPARCRPTPTPRPTRRSGRTSSMR